MRNNAMRIPIILNDIKARFDFEYYLNTFV